MLEKILIILGSISALLGLLLNEQRFGASSSQRFGAITPEDTVIQAIQIAQNSFFIENKRYWQSPNTAGLKPEGEVKAWSDFATLPSSLPFSVEVHKYKTYSDQHGYEIILRKTISGDLWVKKFSVGPENRSHDWKFIPPLPL